MGSTTAELIKKYGHKRFYIKNSSPSPSIYRIEQSREDYITITNKFYEAKWIPLDTQCYYIDNVLIADDLFGLRYEAWFLEISHRIPDDFLIKVISEMSPKVRTLLYEITWKELKNM